MEISYSQCGDYLIPDLILPEAEQKPSASMAVCESTI